MFPRSLAMSVNTCSLTLSGTYLRAVMMPWINVRDGRLSCEMAFHTIRPVVRAVCRGIAKASLKHSRWDHTRTRLSSMPKLNLDSPLNETYFDSIAVQSL
ncbi:hypothetical protein TNCV_1552151 [Trichonephila clavipes]|nr:hypothetical protein TNCV_1552151 [Trichonephila clavipes]